MKRPRRTCPTCLRVWVALRDDEPQQCPTCRKGQAPLSVKR